MKNIYNVVLFLLLICSYSIIAQTELRIMSLNTEWFWDNELPHEGNAFGPRGYPPSELEVKLEAFAIARVIDENKANIVGLIEVENENVVSLIQSYLRDEDWTAVFIKGRDGITGQDVALLTRFEVLSNTETNFGTESPGTEDKKPSKILGVGLSVGLETVNVIVTHFLSKRNESNDADRLKQANYVRSKILGMINNFDHIVLMGDLNDLPDSPPLQRLIGLDDPEPNFIQTAVTTGPQAAFSYIFNNEKQLIDYILLSPSLQPSFQTSDINERHQTIDIGPVSDHRGVMVNFMLN